MDENHKKKKAFRRTKRGYMFKVTILDIRIASPRSSQNNDQVDFTNINSMNIIYLPVAHGRSYDGVCGFRNNFFCHRTSQIWNTLPSLRVSRYINTFKKRLDPMLFDVYVK